MTGFPKAVRELITRRANGHCERCGTPSIVFQLHHRRPRGMGGSKAADTNRPPNGLCVCVSCHAAIEADREEALRFGWLVPQGQDPAAVPVLWKGMWVRFTSDGFVKGSLS